MGSVWVARHVQLGSAVAVKFMDAAYAASPDARGRFEREARAAANLQSPHVVHVGDYGIEDGVPYLVMELLHGEDLSTRLKRVHRISIQEASRILGQVSKALRRAHEVGLVHRDLKPANLFLARIDDEEIAKILDFGIAKQTAGPILGEATETGALLGSPHYMSPEQIRGEKDVDYRSDLWSLGVILFRSLTGKLPFEGTVIGAVLSKILVDPAPIASQLAQDLPTGIDGFFAKALSRDRGLRFQSVREMVDAFAALAGDAPKGLSGATSLALELSPSSARAAFEPIVLSPAAPLAAAHERAASSSMSADQDAEATIALNGRGRAASFPALATPSNSGTFSVAASLAGTGTARGRRSRLKLAAGLLALLVGLGVMASVLGRRAAWIESRDEAATVPTAEAVTKPTTPTTAAVTTEPLPIVTTVPVASSTSAPVLVSAPAAEPMPTAKRKPFTAPAPSPRSQGQSPATKQPSWGF
jgi:serine/threonine-protein kinase